MVSGKIETGVNVLQRRKTEKKTPETHRETERRGEKDRKQNTTNTSTYARTLIIRHADKVINQLRKDQRSRRISQQTNQPSTNHIAAGWLVALVDGSNKGENQSLRGVLRQQPG